MVPSEGKGEMNTHSRRKHIGYIPVGWVTHPWAAALLSFALPRTLDQYFAHSTYLTVQTWFKVPMGRVGVQRPRPVIPTPRHLEPT